MSPEVGYKPAFKRTSIDYRDLQDDYFKLKMQVLPPLDRPSKLYIKWLIDEETRVEHPDKLKAQLTEIEAKLSESVKSEIRLHEGNDVLKMECDTLSMANDQLLARIKKVNKSYTDLVQELEQFAGKHRKNTEM